ncbi:MAG: DUF2207 domain-containing protein [Actinobacteria bacterium]|nr:DUF2207 domain-containing protein [Actinomycetota bacterium]
MLKSTYRGFGGGAASRRRLLMFLMLLTVAVLILIPTAEAQAKSWRIDSMDVVLDVQKNSSVWVEETVTFTFEGSYSYVGRVIPTKNLESLTDIEVLQDGRPLPQGSAAGTWETFMEGDSRIIKVNFALTDASATWVFRYRASGSVFFFDEGDELRWYVFDADTPVPIGRVRATVKLPEPVPPEQMTVALNTGSSVDRDYSTPAAGEAVFEAGLVPPHTNYWVVVGFPKGVVNFEWTFKRVLAAVVPRAGFVLPIAVFLGMLLIWRKRGRDDPSGAHAKYVSEPPSDLSPGLAGALIDEEANVTEVTATIVDLARRGYIDMVEDKEGKLFTKSIMTFRKLKEFDLSGFELKVANALFSKDKDSVSTKELKNHFYKHVQPICNAIYNEVTSRGFFYGNPQKVRQRWVSIAIGAAIVLGGLSFLMATYDIAGWGYWAFGSIVSVVIVFVFSSKMPQRTAKGAEETKKWEAFRNYLRDLTRFQDMSSAKETFEKYLPYAIAFRVEKDWVRRFQDMQVPAPTWYHPVFIPTYTGGLSGTGRAAGGTTDGTLPMGGGGFSLDSISDSLFSGLNNVSNTLTSAPSSSGSGRGAFGGGGGGFGGGFSGGGGGGGFRAG